MRLGKASAYGVFAVLYIAMHDPEGPVQGRTIADSYGIPLKYLLKILQQLVRAQVIQSERGPRGGFRLRRSPGETTLLEIIETLEGTINGDLCIREAIAGAESTKGIIEKLCGQSAQFTRSLLGTTSIKQLIDSELSPVPEPRSSPTLIRDFSPTLATSPATPPSFTAP